MITEFQKWVDDTLSDAFAEVTLHPKNSTSTPRNSMLSPKLPGTVGIGKVHEHTDRSHP